MNRRKGFVKALAVALSVAMVGTLIPPTGAVVYAKELDSNVETIEEMDDDSKSESLEEEIQEEENGNEEEVFEDETTKEEEKEEDIEENPIEEDLEDNDKEIIAEEVIDEELLEIEEIDLENISLMSLFDENEISLMSVMDTSVDTLVANFSFGKDITKSSAYNKNTGVGFSKYDYPYAPWGWKSNIYYPRLGVITPSDTSYVSAANGSLAIGSKVWTETESTGYGVFTYENTDTFDIDVESANYKVEVTLVNPTNSTYNAYLEAEDITKVGGFDVAAGRTVTKSFTAIVTDGQLNLKFLRTSKATSEGGASVQNVYVSNVKVTRLADKQPGAKPTIYLASDSTVQSYDKYYNPQTGWGQVLHKYFGDEVDEREALNCEYYQSQVYESTNAIVENRAIGGRSSKSFIEEGKLDDLLEDIRPGDYLLIQWGHNDATYSRPNRYVASTEFEKWIQIYIDGAKQRGATPVLVTPVARYSYSTDSKGNLTTYNSNFEAYRQVMVKMAKEQGVALVDLTQRSIDVANKYGIEGGKSLWLWVGAGQYEGAYAKGASDSTHLQLNGALKFAQCVAEGIKDLAKGGVNYANERYINSEYKAALGKLASKVVIDGVAVDPNTGADIKVEKTDFKFDFNYNNSATQAGWIGVNQNQMYDAAKGYGWTTAPNNGRARGNNGTVSSDLANMAMDFNLGAGVFAVDVPNGDYEVTVYAADLMAGTGLISSEYKLEGISIGGCQCKQALGSVTGNVRVSDGQLNLEVVNKSPYISGVTIRQTLKAPSGLVETESSITNSNYTFLLGFNMVNQAAGYRVYRKSSTEAEFKIIKTFTAKEYEEDELSCKAMSVPVGDTYQYYMTCYDADNKESAPSNTIVVKALESSIPTHVEGGREVYTDRALVAIGLSDKVTAIDTNGNTLTNGVYLSWRAFDYDFDSNHKLNTSFTVYCNGNVVPTAQNIKTTNIVLTDADKNATYKVEATSDQSHNIKAIEVKPLSQQYIELQLYKPANATMPDNSTCSYTANDMSLGDVDFDGQVELIVKWYPTNAKDNAHSGYTGNTYLDTYDVDWATGKAALLSRIDLGVNIRSGAHYTQFQVWDFDEDGKAEIAVKTADGSTIYKSMDGTDRTLTQMGFVGAVASNQLPMNKISAKYDYRNASGYILSGNEYFTMFNPEEGTILDTVAYLPGRGTVSKWGDGYGNRVDRFLSATAYLDGKHPFAVMCRGYYTRTALTAYGVKDNKIYTYWTYDTDNYGGANQGQGNHNLAVADVDNDGKDEIVYGSSCYDDNGKLLYSTKLGHGDAMHVSDWISWNDGLEVMEVHEEHNQTYQVEIHDAKTGKILIGYPVANTDVGRGMAADIDPTSIDAEFWASKAPSGNGSGEWDSSDSAVIATENSNTKQWNILSANSTPAMNAMIYWDGDLLAEVQDHTFNSAAYAPTGVLLAKWNYEINRQENILYSTEIYSSNGTKGNLGIIADFLGDWREEFIARCANDDSKVRVYTTNYVTDYAVPCMLTDLQYREGVAWENVAYNQPTHSSYLVSKGLVTAQLTSGNVTSTSAEVLFTPANDGTLYGHDITGYEVYRAGTDGKYSKVATIENKDLKKASYASEDSYENMTKPAPVAAKVVKKYDFGNGATASGYTKVTASTLYNRSAGYGFVSTSGLSNKEYGNWNGDANAAVYNDSVLGWITDGSVEFVVDIPNGTYDVTYILANGSGAVYDQVRAEDVAFTDVRRSNNDKQVSRETKTVDVTDGQLNIVNSVSKGGYASIYFTGIIIEENNDAYQQKLADYERKLAAYEKAQQRFQTVDVTYYENNFESTDSGFTLIRSDCQDGEMFGPDTATSNARKGKIYGVGSRVGGDTGSQTTLDLGVDANATVEFDFRMDGCYQDKGSNISLIGSACTTNWLDSNQEILTISASSNFPGYWNVITINGVNITAAANISNGTNNAQSGGKGGLRRDTTGWIHVKAFINFENQTVDVKLTRNANGAKVYEGTLPFMDKNVKSLEKIYIAGGKRYGGVFLDDIKIYGKRTIDLGQDDSDSVENPNSKYYSFVDTTVAAGTTYQYKIAAIVDGKTSYMSKALRVRTK